MNGNIGIQVGASPEAVREARSGIEAIIRSDRDEETTRVALRAFLRICNVSGVSLNGNTITMPSPHLPLVEMTETAEKVGS